MEIRDFGGGVSEKELSLITEKFYRGENAENADKPHKNGKVAKPNGYGLGLYLSKYFMEKMGGGLFPENCENGFMIVVILRLVGS